MATRRQILKSMLAAPLVAIGGSAVAHEQAAPGSYTSVAGQLARAMMAFPFVYSVRVFEDCQQCALTIALWTNKNEALTMGDLEQIGHKLYTAAPAGFALHVVHGEKTWRLEFEWDGSAMSAVLAPVA